MATGEIRMQIEGLKEFTLALAALQKGLEEVSIAVLYASAIGHLANRYRLGNSLDVIAEEFGRLPVRLQDELVRFCTDFPAIVDRG